MSIPWFRVDTAFPHNRKTLKLAADKHWQAIVCYVSALAYCAEQENGGFIPADALAVIHGTPRIAAQLVDVGLWEVAITGWVVHDYEDQALLIQQAKTRREKAQKAANTRWEKKRGESA